MLLLQRESRGMNKLSFEILHQANICRLSQWLQAVVGELGEYANIRKKFERGDLDEEEFKFYAAKELADVQIYFSILAFQLNIDLGQATVDKFNEVSRRINCKVKIAADGIDWYDGS